MDEMPPKGGTTNDQLSKPLCGVTVLVTRPEHQADALKKPLEELGAEVRVQPAIEIVAPHDWRGVDDVIDRLADFDWLVFSSTNGVRFFLDRLRQLAADGNSCLDSFTKLSIAVVGSGTAEELKKYNLRADLVPAEFRAEALADDLVEQISAANANHKRRFLLVRADRGRAILRERLRAAGAEVEEIAVYESRDASPHDPQVKKIAAAMAAGQINWVTVTSSAIARSLVRLFGENLYQVKLVSISPLTSGVLAELGFPPAAEAVRYTMEGVVEALKRSQATGLR